MPRRSLRLREAGYYTGDRSPVVSYKENLQRVFYGKRRRRSGPHNENIVEDNHCVANDSRTADRLTVGTQVSWPCVHDSGSHQPTTNGTQGTGVKLTRLPTVCGFSAKKIGIFLLMFLLSCGFILTNLKLRVTHQELLSLKQQLDMFVPLADMIPNFALESQGARVIQHLSSQSYWPGEDPGLIWRWMFNCWCSPTAQRRVIQGDSALRPGQCWCFAGEQGHLVVSLSHPVSVTHVTLGHISKSQSPDGNIESAPREFSIYGSMSKDEAGTYLGTLVYDPDGARFQTFSLSNPDNSVFRYVKLQTETNWGNVDYTCLYSFRVHGELPP
ncbi:SUN domain-containing protein 3-like [Mugil cephalus]|uniref:SUN domain-containing protein 3-like n=1 Tax=Mugil cephalus TaxID=48193 RepID=UPI001FB65C91|nr:SUN domain-containing protein 3-like [Mugil cephalus]